MSPLGHDTCSVIIVHACTMIIVHACTMIIVHACTIAIGHFCTGSGGRSPSGGLDELVHGFTDTSVMIYTLYVMQATTRKELFSITLCMKMIGCEGKRDDVR